jgi:hypothetical protein
MVCYRSGERMIISDRQKRNLAASVRQRPKRKELALRHFVQATGNQTA